MKNSFPLILKRMVCALTLLILTSAVAWSANTKESVTSVSEIVTLDSDVDYTITSATPFGENGVVNIVNTDHAVLILKQVKPSAGIKLLADHVQINGEKAVNNTNCQVKIYNLGCIIMPYSGGDKFKPLTVYSERNFQGTSVNDFGLEHSGGYMNTLTAGKLNNKIRSFKLKRGYMVTFSLRSGGRGYSRCFIAADKDLEVAELPAIMDKSISSYRVFKWYDAGKKQLANQVDEKAMSALNVQSSYDWGQGNASLLPDYEWVPNHIYEDYPSSSVIGSVTHSPHTKTNNEPRNSADDHPQDLATILGNWENMMRTGLRLCSPASWDGSDYWNATGFLAEFMDSINARGWRCDILDLHCYWPEGNFGNIANWVNKYKRPVWISEWCWGASWNSDGAFASGVTETQVRDALQRICTRLNGFDYVERYYYWNGERDPSHIYKNGVLTPAGEMYAALDGGLGYNGKYDYVPNSPTQYEPSGLSVEFDKTEGAATLNWHEVNGEMNEIQYVERRLTDTWEKIDTIDLKESESNYTYTDTNAVNGCRYRVTIIDANGKIHRTKEIMAVSNDAEPGDPVMVDEKVKYMGGNIFLNGDFDLGTYGWATGTGTPLSAPYFQVVPVGGYENGSYLQFYGGGDETTESALYNSFAISPNTDYYFSGMTCYTNGLNDRLLLNELGVTTPARIAYLSNTTGTWTGKFSVFNSESNNNAILSFAKAKAQLQVDRLLLAPLFDTEEEAIADGMKKIREKATAFTKLNTLYTFLNDDLNAILATYTEVSKESMKQMTKAVQNAIAAYNIVLSYHAKWNLAEKIIALDLYGKDAVQQAMTNFQQVQNINDVFVRYDELVQAIDAALPYTSVSSKIKNPKFTSATSWTISGTYTGGDQRANKVDNVSFWNAWWSGIDANDLTKTMAVKQTSSALDHGLYAVECQASTQHFCLSDQHGFITNGEQTEQTNKLTADYMDLSSVSKTDRWQTLISAPVYVADNGTVTIGFESSKNGVMGDNVWREVGNIESAGDKREGWWGATSFALKFMPMYKGTFVPDQWATICLPYAVHPSVGVKFYEIAGVNSTYTKLCLEEVEEAKAGVPYFIKPEKEEITFLEYGSKSSAKIGACNLWGQLKTTINVLVGYYAMANGELTKVTDSSTAPKWDNYSAALAPFGGTSTAVPVFENWDGPTITINGVTEEEREANNIATTISLPVKNSSVNDGFFTLDGRHVSEGNLKAGLYIRVVNGHAYKTIIK